MSPDGQLPLCAHSTRGDRRGSLSMSCHMRSSSRCLRGLKPLRDAPILKGNPHAECHGLWADFVAFMCVTTADHDGAQTLLNRACHSTRPPPGATRSGARRPPRWAAGSRAHHEIGWVSAELCVCGNSPSHVYLQVRCHLLQGSRSMLTGLRVSHKYMAIQPVGSLWATWAACMPSCMPAMDSMHVGMYTCKPLLSGGLPR